MTLVFGRAFDGARRGTERRGGMAVARERRDEEAVCGRREQPARRRLKVSGKREKREARRETKSQVASRKSRLAPWHS